LHDALRVSDSTREIGELENESKAIFLSMAISVICLADRTNKASSSKSFFALIWCIVRFYSQVREKGDATEWKKCQQIGSMTALRMNRSGSVINLSHCQAKNWRAMPPRHALFNFLEN